MPQVDVEAIVCGGGDARDACETQFAVAQPPAPDDPDFPPESVVVPVGDDGLDWADVGAAVYDRDDSTKGSTNPKAQAQRWQPAKPRSSSHRFSGGIQAKPPIIGLPGKVQQHSSYLGRSGHRPTRAPIFPKKPPPVPGAARGRKSTVPEQEPGSPMVSCIGKVLSETERDRYPKRRRQSPEEEEKMERVEPTGCWASVTATFCCGGEESTAQETKPGDAPGEAAGERRIAAEPAMEPPALGAMRRFASGRRPPPLDRDAPARGWRRSVGSVEDAWRERDWDWDASASFDGADGNMLKTSNGMW
ncbi:hypothetical protein C4D60_Mb05t17800 [Musa balbisiana]|uniref:Uncharacterized protein n=1 Tax=Musa balbisiana TaxID=52838 RepID=A0A4S8JWX7_MUSBA|nr:hypothetical protein C4D60_Mb05t17800 [Musa balbisiana]